MAYQCPKCKSKCKFCVSGIVYATAYIDSDGNVKTEAVQDCSGAADIEWTRDSWISCNACDHDGAVHQFEI